MNLPDASPYAVVKSRITFPDFVEDRPYQIDTINELAPLPRAGYYLGGGCVDANTEYLSPSGWARIADYAGGPVGQYHPDIGVVDFVEPDEFVKLPCAEMIRFKTKYGVDQLLSPEHRMLYKSYPGGKLRVKSAEQIELAHHRNQTGWKGGKFPTAFAVRRSSCIPMTPEQLRLQVAVIADGHFPCQSLRCVVRLKKDRKQHRLTELLMAAGVVFRVNAETWDGCEEFVRFEFDAPRHDKVFDRFYWDASAEQLAIVADEMIHWDGCQRKGGEFSTSEEASADFIQYAVTSTGRRASKHQVTRVRAGRPDSTEYTVLISQGDHHVGIAGGQNTKSECVWREPTPDGFKYCFSVPSTFLVFRRNGNIFASGNTGKTYCATVGAYYKRFRQGADITVIVMPPILILGWKRWLEGIKPMPKVLTYEGTPKKRDQMVLRGNDFILMSMAIFKRDYERLLRDLDDLKVTLIVDEAHSIKNISSDNHKKVFELVSAGADVMPLTATPLSTPMDGYAFVKMIAPGTYRNLKQFTNVHVEEWDYFNNPKKWQNLDLLRDNMRINSVWLQRREVKQDLPPVIYTPMRYQLDAAHYALYKQLAEEQILELENGGKIDATQESALHHAMQQIVLNWDYFSQNPANVARGLELIEEVFDEVGGKLVVVASYRMTNRKLLELLKKFNAVGAYGDIPGVQQSRNVDRFINDQSCGIFVLQPTSAGYGLDGLQHVCADMLFMELPQVPKDFHQTVWRLDRDGQKDAVNVRIAVADGTIQVRKLKQMMEKNDLIGRVQPNLQDLRAAIFGG